MDNFYSSFFLFLELFESLEWGELRNFMLGSGKVHVALRG